MTQASGLTTSTRSSTPMKSSAFSVYSLAPEGPGGAARQVGLRGLQAASATQSIIVTSPETTPLVPARRPRPTS
jgi:hypothetical protein